MPYVDSNTRDGLADVVHALKLAPPATPGELNYLVTQVILRYWWNQVKPSYQTVNDIVGALEGAKLEFYRRVAAPYEDTKIAENGDVY